jgi:hypothetical protein
MRFGSMLVLGSACLLLFGALSACGGKVYESGDDAAGSAGSGGSGGTAGSGGTLLGGSGGMPGGSGGGTAGVGGTPAGSGGGPAGSGGYPAGSGGGPAGGGGSPAGSGGGPGGTGGYAGGSCWNLLPPVSECRDCLDMNCCGEVISCFEDPTGYCPQILDCYENCPMGDPYECASMCDNGNFNIEFNDVFECGASYCAGPCMNPVPPPDECPLQTADPPCDNCMQTKCGAECNACVNNSQCMDLLYCATSCSDDACQQQCFDTYPNGVDVLLEFLGVGGCLEVNCSNECY